MTDPVRYEVRDRIAHVTIDHGKANVLTPDLIATVDSFVGRAEDAGPQEVGALLISGSAGFLSGGFDLSVITSSPQAAGELVTSGGALFVRMLGSPVPVVVACTGHAVAAGALMLLGADERIGVAGNFKIGLLETAKGMVLPRWAVELAEARLSRRHLQLATVGARMYDPIGARDAGFLDAVVDADEIAAAAQGVAASWAELPREAYVGQIKMNRGALLERLATAIERDRGRGFRIDPV